MIRASYHFFRDIYLKRSIIMSLVARDIQQQYTSSYLGIVWVFLQPLLFILVLYLVFTVGLRAGPSGDMPFGLYLVCGIVSWLYFSRNLSANTAVINNYSFLVKKVSFRLTILPIVTLLSGLVVHVFLLAVAIGLSWYMGYPPTVYTFQVVYYFAAMFLLLLGLAWITSACSLFVKDVSNVVSIVIQFGFWLTPIFWNVGMIPSEYRWLIEINPMYYIVDGYRDSIVLGVGFWEKQATPYYWIVTLVFLLIGINVFKKLKPHFAEVI